MTLENREVFLTPFNTNAALRTQMKSLNVRTPGDRL